ncbi:MAG: ABC transporter ATP-binding protein [Spirochaetales bacterium]|nr:ABC transporter ATP-binding protein [Spirochaetales bacterium]
MIRAIGVGFQYAGYEIPSLGSTELEAREGQLIVLQGENGSGKSTFLRCLAGLMPQFYQGTTHGELTVDGLDAFAADPHEFFGRCALVSQEPRSQAFCPNLFEEIAFGLRNLGLKENISFRVEEAAEAVGLTPFLGHSVRTLSGGQQKLALLACHLALRPKILLLDEPLANLDEDSQRRLIQLIAREKSQGTLLIVSEHQRGPLSAYTDEVLTLKGPAVQLPTEQPLPLASLPPRLAITGWLAKDCDWGHQSVVLSDINFHLPTHPGLLITGANGSGKTTLLKALRGLLPPRRGRLDFNGVPLKKQKISQMASVIGYAGQHSDQHFFCLTVKEELEASAHLCGRYDANWLEWLSQQWGLNSLAERPPYHLSGGEKRRLLLAASLAARPELLLWDEPTAGLDSVYQNRVKAMISQLQAHGFSVIASEHHENLPLERRMHLKQGQVFV